MSKVAKLVYISMVTRVIVDENAPDHEIVEASRRSFANKVRDELHENVEDIIDDYKSEPQYSMPAFFLFKTK